MPKYKQQMTRLIASSTTFRDLVRDALYSWALEALDDEDDGPLAGKIIKDPDSILSDASYRLLVRIGDVDCDSTVDEVIDAISDEGFLGLARARTGKDFSEQLEELNASRTRKPRPKAGGSAGRVRRSKGAR